MDENKKEYSTLIEMTNSENIYLQEIHQSWVNPDEDDDWSNNKIIFFYYGHLVVY